MNQTFESGERLPAKERLLDAAEELFASRGIQATSIRDITRHAAANLAAVNYHYGSKEGLLRAVIKRRLDPLNRRRLEMLDQAGQAGAGSAFAVERVLEAFLSPTVEMSREHPRFLQLVGRLLTEPDAGLKAIFYSQFADLFARFHAALVEALPMLPERDLLWRFHFTLGAMAFTWTNRADIERHVTGRKNDEEPRKVVERLVAFCAAGMRAPVKGENE